MWVPYSLSKYDPDSLRFYLTATAPETRNALTYDHSGAIGTWSKSELPAGQALPPPAPLFKKLDESVSEEEYKRLAG